MYDIIERNEGEGFQVVAYGWDGWSFGGKHRWECTKIYTSPVIHLEEDKSDVLSIVSAAIEGGEIDGFEINCLLGAAGIACGWSEAGKQYRFEYKDCVIHLTKHRDGVVTVDLIFFKETRKVIQPCCGNRIPVEEMAASAFERRHKFGHLMICAG